MVGELLRLDASVGFLATKVLDEDVLEAVSGGFFLGDGSSLSEGFDERIVLSDLLQVAIAEEVDAAVADVGDVQMLLAGDEHRDGGSHRVVIGVDGTEGEDFSVGFADGIVDDAAEFDGIFLDPFDLLGEFPGDEVDGHFAGFFAGGLSSHTVGDEEESALVVDHGAVFVIVAEVPGDALHSPTKGIARRLDRLFGRLRLEECFPQRT